MQHKTAVISIVGDEKNYKDENSGQVMLYEQDEDLPIMKNVAQTPHNDRISVSFDDGSSLRDDTEKRSEDQVADVGAERRYSSTSQSSSGCNVARIPPMPHPFSHFHNSQQSIDEHENSNSMLSWSDNLSVYTIAEGSADGSNNSGKPHITTYLLLNLMLVFVLCCVGRLRAPSLSSVGSYMTK